MFGEDWIALPNSPKLPYLDLPDGFPGLMSLSNNKKANYFVINNGRFVPGLYGQTIEWNGMQTLPDEFWPKFGPTPSAEDAGDPGICQIIGGTDGSQVRVKTRLWEDRPYPYLSSTE